MQMRHEVLTHLQAVALSSADVDEIFELYALARSNSPYGFLAVRDKDDFREIFHRPEPVIGTGIRDSGRLIAYSICHRVATNPYPGNPVLAMIEPSASTIYHGDGTVVHPGYRGRMLAQRITRLRKQQIAERRIDHVLGLIAVDNIVSVGNAVLGGLLLVGFARDETSLNYIAYHGCLRDGLSTDATPVNAGLKDHDRQQRLFAERKVICDFKSPNKTGLSAGAMLGRQFVFLPIGPPG